MNKVSDLKLKDGSIISLVEMFDIPPPLSKYKIYCDMDGVLTDFTGRFDYFTGLRPEQYKAKYGTDKFWKLIDVEVGLVFWSKMPWTPRGRELWSFLKQFNPELLTSPSSDDSSKLGKNTWVRNNLSPQPKVNFIRAKEKHDFACPTCILIDDREDTIDRWNKAGGIGIHHPENTTSISPIVNQIKKILNV